MKEQTFIQLISENQGIIHKVCNVYTDNEEDHKDLFQEILYQLWASVSKFQEQSKFTTWMYKVALYTAIARLRKETTREKHILQFGQESSMQVEPENMENREDILQQCMNHLSETDKAITLLYLEEYNYQEMAEILGISENNVGVKINRIKKKLRDIFKKINHG